jgi:tetratricopeptide (TPR) repeat protein
MEGGRPARSASEFGGGAMFGARRSWLFLFPVACLLFLLLSGAAAQSHEGAEELIRRANAAFLRDDLTAADQLYAAAEERTADPGLVAFNKAAVLFQKGEFRDAEQHYARVLDDKACPPDRAARAWFNRGTCLLRRGGIAPVYRSAVACFERCLDLNPPDESLRADARHNLELAKLLWVEANKKADKPETPNTHPPREELPEHLPPPLGGPDQEPGATQPGGTDGPNGQRPTPQPVPAPAPGGHPRETDTKAPGANANLQTLKDTDQVQPLSPEDTREYLKRTAARLERERQEMLKLLYGPDRPGVRDW